MSDVAETGFALRGAERLAAEKVYKEVRAFERERRTMRAVTVMGGWVVASLMTVVAAGAVGIYLHRPVPRDQIYVAVMHDDGTYEAPVSRDDLAPSQRNVVIRYSLSEYIKCREEYSWEGVNTLYKRCSAMSDRDEQVRYQATVLDQRDPRNPYKLYGTGVNAGRVEVTGLRMLSDSASPNAVNAMVTVRMTPPATLMSGPSAVAPKTVRRIIHMTWDQPDRPLPIEVQQQYDPAGIVVTHYASDLDPDTKGNE